MPTYTLDIAFSAKDLQDITNAQQEVTIARPAHGGHISVAWLMFHPMMQNEVSWTESYTLFASGSQAAHGERITMLSESAPAEPGAYYRFTGDLQFSGPFRDRRIDARAFALQNDVPAPNHPVLMGGLALGATVNGRPLGSTPVHAQMVLSGTQLTITPVEQVAIWLQSMAGSGTVITRMPPATVLTFPQGVTTLKVRYNAATGMFDTVS